MTININGGATTNYLYGSGLYTTNPSVLVTPIATSTGGTTSPLNVKDILATTIINTTNNVISSNLTINTITNNTPTICDTSAFFSSTPLGLVTTLANGVGNVVINTTGGNLYPTFGCVTTTSTTGYLTGYATNSLAKRMNDLVISAIGSYTAPDPSFMNLYSSGYTINSNLYTKNIIDTSPFTDNGYGYGAELISPRHILYPTHASPSVGQSITFTRADGTTTTKTITVVTRNLNGYNGSDIGIGYLDSAVTGITPYSVLPPTDSAIIKLPFATTLMSQIYGPVLQGIFGFYLKCRHPFGYPTTPDPTRQMQLSVGTSITPTGAMIGGVTNPFTYSNNDLRYTLTTNWRPTFKDVGDSGSPWLLPTGLTTATGTPLTILIGATYVGIENVASYGARINIIMNAIKDAGDTTVYAIDDISTSTKSITDNGTATTGAAWWNSLPSY